MPGISARFFSVHDSDTPKILKNGRMLGIDTPEKEYSFRKASEYDYVLPLCTCDAHPVGTEVRMIEVTSTKEKSVRA